MQNDKPVRIRQDVRITDRGKRIDIHVPDGDSITLNDSAAVLFRALNSGKTISEALNDVAAEFEADLQTLQEDAEGFLEGLALYGVIE